MKKKQIANIVMVAVILVIAAAGILTVGCLQGWFDQAREGDAVLSRAIGIVNMERGGIAYSAEEDTVLRAGDRLTTTATAKATISVGGGWLVLNEHTTLAVVELTAEGLSVEVISGEAFVYADGATRITLTFQERSVSLKDAAVLLSVRSGAESVSVLYGSVTAQEQTAGAREMLSWVGEELTVLPFGIQSLNDFTLDQIRSANETVVLCFSNEDLDLLEAERLAAMQELLNQTEPPATIPETTSFAEPSDPTEPVTTSRPESGGSQGQQPAATEPPETTVPPTTHPETTTPPETVPPQTEPPETTAPPETTQPQNTCTIAIRCDTILNHWDDLDPAKAGYVPGSGCILPSVTVAFEEGETVFDVLQRVCATFGIQLEYSWTPMYNSYYIEGINHLYEFDCGSESGWMYKVNGWFPNYGCSSYTLKDGDVIVWCYTCQGLGADVGG